MTLKPYRVIAEHSAFGRSSLTLVCPWCGCEVVAYKWSLAGSGKRCPCGAKFLSGSNALSEEAKS